MFLPIGLEHRVGPLQKERHSHKRTINHNNNNPPPPPKKKKKKQKKKPRKKTQPWNNKYTNHLIFIIIPYVC